MSVNAGWYKRLKYNGNIGRNKISQYSLRFRMTPQPVVDDLYLSQGLIEKAKTPAFRPGLMIHFRWSLIRLASLPIVGESNPLRAQAFV